MGFVRKIAKTVLPFGIIGNALLKDKKKKADKPATSLSLLTAGSDTSGPSLVSRNGG